MPEHIKMPDVAPLVRYLADGEQVSFVYPFPVFASEDLSVYFDGAPQYAGFEITGAGATEGGTVEFETAPPEGVILMLERRLPLERLTDFIEGGDFSARALNNELDFLTAAIQQVGRDQAPMLRYSDDEEPADVVLPPKNIRASKALGFDEDGNPVAVTLEGAMAAPDFTASGTGAATRTSSDKFGDQISARDFGAAGDGLTDDTLAIQQALAAHDSVFLPPGVYLITAPLTVGEGQSLCGAGQSTIIGCSSGAFNALEMTAGHAYAGHLRIEDGSAAIKLYGRDGPCIQNVIENIEIAGAQTGILLDGGEEPDNPCYGNNFSNILISEPGAYGVWLTRTGAGENPGANRFHRVRVSADGAETGEAGIYVEYGTANNSFTDCEVHVNGVASACVRIGAQAQETLLVNLLTDSDDGMVNVRLNEGSAGTALVNLTALSEGAVIVDDSGGAYCALNAGDGEKNTLTRTRVSDLCAELMRYEVELIEETGTVELDLSHSRHLVSAIGGALTVVLPDPEDADGVEMTVKKIDGTDNIVTVSGAGGLHPDNVSVLLGAKGDHVTALSYDGAWFITSCNRMAGGVRTVSTAGTYAIDMAVDYYLISASGGAVTAQLPPANAAKAAGRRVTIKKTDSSGNAVTVTEQGGSGADQASQSLGAQYRAITVFSDGSHWFVLSKYT